MYPRPIPGISPIKREEERQFIFPFLVGAVTGGAAVGLTRPRPVYNNQGPYYQNQPYQPYYTPGAPYSNYSYSYYVPYR